jgi:hypothetical protein
MARSGNALVLALFILLSLTAVGVVGVQRTNTELMVAGNVSRTLMAGSGADAAMLNSMGLLGRDPIRYALGTKETRAHSQKGLASMGAAIGGISSQVATCRPLTDALRLGMDITCRSSALPDPSLEPGHYLPVVDDGSPTARLLQQMVYDGEVVWIGEIQGTAGNQVDAKLCFQFFDVNVRGTIPSRQGDIATTLCPPDDAACIQEALVIRGRSRMLVGPTPCYLSGGS